MLPALQNKSQSIAISPKEVYPCPCTKDTTDYVALLGIAVLQLLGVDQRITFIPHIV